MHVLEMDVLTIDDLSDDVLIVIFKILQIYPFALRRVCKRWCALAKYLYRIRDVNCTNSSHEHSDYHIIERYISIFPKVSFKLFPVHTIPDDSDVGEPCSLKLFELAKYKKKITAFHFDESPSDIHKLHKFTDVTEIYFSHFTSIRSLKHIKKLDKLTRITVEDDFITSINNLRHLVKLQSVNIRASLVENVSSLRFLSLTELDMSFSKIQNKSCEILAGITTLRRLNLAYTNISDISPLSSLNLTDFCVSHTRVTDISVVKNFSRLISLNIGGLDVSDISAVTHLTRLQYLWMRRVDVSDINPLENLVNLRTLDISHNPYIKDISPLRNMGSLTFLDITETSTIPKVLDVLPHMSLEKIRCDNIIGWPD